MTKRITKDQAPVVVKPRVRIAAGSTRSRDSFTNFAAQLGLGADNTFSAGRYNFDFTTRNRTLLEAAYRTSWVVGAAVDIPAEDMTSAGITLDADFDQDTTSNMIAAQRDLMLDQKMAEGVRWSRLFGGAIGVILVDGQSLSTPLRTETVRKDAFRGIMVLDRWRVNPSVTDLVTDLGPDLGDPKFYQVVTDAQALSGKRIHYSRVIRFIGHDLPYYQKMSEMLWGMSIVERIHDRLLAFDSTSQGAAQLAFKAHLRTFKIENLRDLIAAGGDMYAALLEQVALIRRMQTSEGLTLLDSADEMQMDTYTFAGLADIITSQGEQLAGAIEIPMVRLFGQAPGGLNTDGGSALATYYDGNKRKQENKLRRPWAKVLDVLCRSVTGKQPPPGFTFTFNPLGQVTAEAKSTIAKNVESAVSDAYDKGMITQKVAMQELRTSSRVTGVFGSITQEDIDEAEDEFPDPGEGMIDPSTGLPYIEAPAGGGGGTPGDPAATPGAATEGNLGPASDGGRSSRAKAD